MHASETDAIRCAIACGCAVFIAGAAHAASWKVRTGGAIDDTNNWSADPTTESAEFMYTQSAPLTQTAETFSIGAPSGNDFVFTQGAANSFVGELALGMGHTLRRNGSGNHYFRGPYVCRLTSGTMAFPEGTCVIGDTVANPGAFYVDGPYAALEIRYFRMLAETAGIHFEALNGGRISGRMVTDGKGRGVSMLVTGANSVYELPSGAAGGIYVGAHGSNNVFRVEDGGSYVDNCGSQDFNVGRSMNRDGYGMAYGHNRLEVFSGATFSHASYLYTGFDTPSNTFTVASGATATIGRDLVIGYQRYHNNDGRYYPADGNSVLVTGEGSRLCVTGECYVGRQYASGCILAVEDGGKIELKSKVSVGTDYYCTNNQMIARSGGLIEVDASVFLGYATSGCNSHRILVDGGTYHQMPSRNLYMRQSPGCRIEVVNGGYYNATNASIYVGDTGAGDVLNHVISIRSGGTLKCSVVNFGVACSSNTVEVDNGTLEASGGAYFGHGGGTGNSLVLSGTNAHFNVGTAIFRNGAHITFNVPVGGYASSPFVASGQEFAEGTRVVVNKHQDEPGGYRNRIVLMRTGSPSFNSTISNIVWQIPDGARLDLAETNPQEIAITFRRNSGLCVIVR